MKKEDLSIVSELIAKSISDAMKAQPATAPTVKNLVYNNTKVVQRAVPNESGDWIKADFGETLHLSFLKRQDNTIVEELKFTLWEGSYEDLFSDKQDLFDNLDCSFGKVTVVKAGGLIPTADGRELVNNTGEDMNLVRMRFVARK
jgi:hypothetical protein